MNQGRHQHNARVCEKFKVENLDSTKVSVSVATDWKAHCDLVFTLEAERFDVDDCIKSGSD